MANLFDIAVARKLSGGGGGGNPNTVQTVTGTLANPWGSISYGELSNALYNKNATAYLEIDASALGAGTIASRPTGDGFTIYTNGANLQNDLASSTAFTVLWSTSGDIYAARMLNGGNIVDIHSYASILPTTLVVVWHPIPDTPPVPPT